MRFFNCLPVAFLAIMLAVAPCPAQGPDGPGGGRGFGGGFRGGSRGGFGDPNQFFDRLSGGKDVVTRSELNPWQQQMFDRLAQTAGVSGEQLTRDQFLKASEQMRQNFGMGGGRGAQGPRGDQTNQTGGGNNRNPDARAEESFQRLDANKDGVLNNDEMPEALRAERDKWDTDKNGLISLDEYKAYFLARAEQRRQGRGDPAQNGAASGGNLSAEPMPAHVEEVEKKPIAYRAGKLPKELPAWFDQYDTDKDGQIGLYEWKNTGRPLDEFFKIDRNGDGFLTIDEVLYFERASGRLTVSAAPATEANPPPTSPSIFSPAQDNFGSTQNPGNNSDSSAPGQPGAFGGDRGGMGRWNGPPGGGQFWRGGGRQFGPGGGDRRGGDRGNRGNRGGGNFSQRFGGNGD
jgi:Ca2+-binding EF-hand superfamily protein